jgi:hypothetical protein
MSYYDVHCLNNTFALKNKFNKTKVTDVKQALVIEELSRHDFAALLSPAAEPYLEKIAEKALRNFG